ncbi:MAG: tetratricopeptide repeat protein, partial [Deferribacteres bacterium]|nr:tetratricopeptide repeat protein [Deferribacteres bacterium]
EKYFQENRFIEAIEMFERVIKLDPDNVDAYNDLGLAYHYTGRSDIAVDRLRMGAVVGPSYQRIWLSLGFVLLSKGKTEDARLALQKAVELDPDSGAGREAKSMLEGLR